MTTGKGRNLDFALIGNCRIAALVDSQARIVWWCTPRFDSDPVFSRLLAGDEEKGFCDVVLADQVECQSTYVRNTAIVETILRDSRGAAVKITDFAPRFRQFDRLFRPAQLFRRIEPIAGLPRITIRVRPDLRLWPPLYREGERIQPHPLSRRRVRRSSQHRRAALLHRA